VVAGGHGWLQEPILRKIKESSRRNDILQLGSAPEGLLPALYWHASVFLFPSLYEGFGLPILEAMASGCPVVTSNVSSMPEVAGEGNVVLVDPYHVEDIASGVMQAWEGRAGFVARGLVQAMRFSWDRTAQQTLNVLKSF
jgi:alpha-1,3-rhamnosyl/mannosyltransferase